MHSDTVSEDTIDIVDSILRRLRDNLGVDFTEYRRSTIERRLKRRLMTTHCASEADYLRLLDNDPAEYQHLLRELTVKFSEFYRDPSLWSLLESQFLPDVLQRKADAGDSKVRIWTAGSAMGEETYTAAMVLDRVQKRIGTNLYIEIIGTDIDASVLERACLGEYAPTVMSKLPQDYLAEYFIQNKTFAVSGRLKQMVSFRCDNLLDPSPSDGSLDGFDVIFCRNVLIYLTRPLQIRVLERLAQSLNTDGVLILGTAEIMPRHLESQFKELRRELRILQRKKK